VDFSLHEVLDAAEQIIGGEVWTLEDEIALIVLSLEVSTRNATAARRVDTSEPVVRKHAAPQSNADASCLVIIGLYILLVGGSIMLVNWYFRSTYGV
jgi:hypothetical protein